METKSNLEDSSKEMISAVLDRLSDIVDLELDAKMMKTPKTALMPVVSARRIDWVNKDVNPKGAVTFCKETFKVILAYLQKFYKTQEAFALQTPAMDHIKTIMVLVGEAAKKLDVYTALFHDLKIQSVTSLPEYKKLQEFYQNRIAHQIDDNILGKWILALSKRVKKEREIELTAKTKLALNHVFIDLDSVKNDDEYELFFIRKGDGTRFYHPKLLRNLKLISDFTVRGEGNDPLSEIVIWEDEYESKVAQSLLNSVNGLLGQFYQRAFKCKNQEIVVALNKILFALMLCSDAQNNVKSHKMKSCANYFQDFISFLSQLLHSNEYHKLLTYPPGKNDIWKICLLNLIHTICSTLFTSINRFQLFSPKLNDLLLTAQLERSSEHQNVSQNQEIWMRLANENAALTKLFKRHQSGPLEKVLQILSKENSLSFDPMTQMNLFNHLYNLSLGKKNIQNLYIPSPTTQEYINKVCVLNEFKGFLRNYHRSLSPKKHLLINLQDRTSWKEHARCAALEGLSASAELAPTYAVATLAKETEFYHQSTPYDKNNLTTSFLELFEEHLNSEISGYFFMNAQKQEIKEFIPNALKAIHHLFFTNKNLLLREHRLDFIEIFHLFLILKLIDIEQPDSFSLTCKDGVDVASSVNCLLFAFLKMLSGKSFTAEDWDNMNMLIYAPSILVRERIISSERYSRMLGALKTLELAHKELGAQEFAKSIHEIFGPLLKNGILKASIV